MFLNSDLVRRQEAHAFMLPPLQNAGDELNNIRLISVLNANLREIMLQPADVSDVMMFMLKCAVISQSVFLCWGYVVSQQ